VLVAVAYLAAATRSVRKTLLPAIGAATVAAGIILLNVVRSGVATLAATGLYLAFPLFIQHRSRLALVFGAALFAAAASVPALLAFSTPISPDTASYWSMLADSFWCQPGSARCRRLKTRAAPTSSVPMECAGELAVAEAAQQAGINSAGLSACMSLWRDRPCGGLRGRGADVACECSAGPPR
jgi:hypothetical protein